MKLVKIPINVILFIIFCGCVSAQTIRFTNASSQWNSDELGNIRAVVNVDQAGKAAFVKIDWRRRDKDPRAKNIIVTDANGIRIKNVKRGSISRESGEIFFQPTKGAGTYYVYYLPYQKSGSPNYPKDFYPKFEETADPAWLQSVSVTKPNAAVTEIQAIDPFNSFYPMEVIATASETQKLIAENSGKAFLVFPEDRLFSIRMTDDLPQRWIEKGVQRSFTGEARRGEFYAFQFGVFALKPLKNVSVEFSDLKDKNGKVINRNNLTCINMEGVDYRGRDFELEVDVEKDKVQAIWCGADVEKTVTAGDYKGVAKISAKGEKPQEISIELKVNNQIAENGGFNEPEKMTRLKWLNSRLAQENSIIPPYSPITVKGNELSFLGRKLTLNYDGLPRSIKTFFTPEMTSISDQAKDILRKPISLKAVSGDGREQIGKFNPLKITKKDAGTVAWQTSSVSPGLLTEIDGQLEFDGFVTYQIKITATKDIDFSDIKLEMPFSPDSAKYMMGLGEKGEKRPENFSWKWDVAAKNQDGAWLGDVNAGLQFSLRDEKYVRPLNTNFYLQKPLRLPDSWGNEGKGGINITTQKDAVLVNNFSGARSLKKGETVYFNFNLLITPFHTIDTDWQWASRFYHRYSPIDEIKKTGATVVNIHHANEINPYINYPFIAHKKMKAYIDEAHQKGLKVKIYNTIRELSNRAYETFALRSLGHEVYSSGKGGGFPWLQEHIGEDYIAAWFVPDLKDAAIVNSGVSRWHNYYVEGMNWLTQNVGIDGIYLDDVAFDRFTMKRVKRVLTQDGRPGIIDFHSANQFNKNDGFNNSAMLYMEHFPYVNRLWFGEYFDYENNSPDFFLTEVSGIPFGLMGEMLEKGGNPWRGMIYGMTNRMPWSDNADPRPIWKVWDDFGMQGTKMFGYWSPNCPVKTDNPDVLATAYVKNGTALISIASWAKEDVKVRLKIDWKALGIDPKTAKLVAPDVKAFQTGQTFAPTDQIKVPKNKGWMLIVK
ncbi:MAG: hypothetical protein KDB79_13170 [Acidobacteria bacterium]|nr:hypothetical protein [Acidobacteriota bacterium]